MKTHAYIDGFNLYHGMMDWGYNMPGSTAKPALRQYLWLNLDSFICSYFAGNISLEQIHYFTAPVRDNQDALDRQEKYWKALESLPHLSIHKGVNARRYDRDWNIIGYVEKQSDVWFGLQALEDALREPDLQRMVFLCADADQVPTIEKIQHLRADIDLQLIFPPCRQSGDLSKLIPNPIKTRYEPLRDNQFPDPVEYERDGSLISVAKPPEWV